MNLAWNVRVQDLVQGSAGIAPQCFCESAFPDDPCCRDGGYGDYQPLPVASFGIFLNETLYAVRKTPNLPIFSCSASILERMHRVEGVCVCCCPCSDVLWGVVCWQACSALQRCGMASELWQEPASCVWAGRSSGTPCQQHCPKAAWQQSRKAGHSSGSAPGPPEPRLVLASGLMASEVCQSGTAKTVSCACWPCDKAWRALGKQPAAEAGPVLLTHHSHCHRDWLFFENMPNPSGRLKMSTLRGNGWVCQICWLFISRAFNYISELVNFEWMNICCNTWGFFHGFFFASGMVQGVLGWGPQGFEMMPPNTMGTGTFFRSPWFFRAESWHNHYYNRGFASPWTSCRAGQFSNHPKPSAAQLV